MQRRSGLVLGLGWQDVEGHGGVEVAGRRVVEDRSIAEASTAVVVAALELGILGTSRIRRRVIVALGRSIACQHAGS